MKRLLSIVAVAGLATAANAQFQTFGETGQINPDVRVTRDVLWNQTANLGVLGNVVDQEFGDFPTYSSYIVSDVTVGAGGWIVDSVSTFYTMGSGNWNGVNTARLNIFPYTGGLPGAGDDPTTGMTVGITLTDIGGIWQAKASGLGLNLPAGDYWIGLTPHADFGVYGQEFHVSADAMGNYAMSGFRNPGGAFGYGTGWLDNPYAFDAAMLIEGVIPTPGTLSLLGLCGLAALRRRR